MADWLDVWSSLGKEQGLELDMLEPVRLTIGGLQSPEKASELCPVMWVASEFLDDGALDIHKQFFLGNGFREPFFICPSPYMSNAGQRDTLRHFTRMVHNAEEAGIESLAQQVLALFTAASIHEYENGYYPKYKGESSEAERHIDDWLTKNSPFLFQWHLRSTTLGPDTSFLESLDFYGMLGEERPATIKEFCQVLISGHRRVLDEYRLVIPSFQQDLPAEIETDLLDWWDELQAREDREAAAREMERAEREAKNRLWQERMEKKWRSLLSPAKRNQEFPPLSWQNTTNEHLQELLLEAPMTELAVRFSVSETAIRKRVKTAGLAQPKRGHRLRPAHAEICGGAICPPLPCRSWRGNSRRARRCAPGPAGPFRRQSRGRPRPDICLAARQPADIQTD